jgi:hypothetical protein
MLFWLLVLCAILVLWLRWKKKHPSSTAGRHRLSLFGGMHEMAALDLGGASNFSVSVVGESHYQAELRRIAKDGRTFVAALIPEPENPVHPLAIRVCANDGGTVGHLSRGDARAYREVFEKLSKHGKVAACKGKLIGGYGDKHSFGVVLDLREPASLLTDIRDTLEPSQSVSESVAPS